MAIHFDYSKQININKLKQLYDDVQWHVYTKDLTILNQAILHSLEVITAWDKEKLVGLIRVVGDGSTIIYIQDILVLNDYQNQGIASELMQKMLNKYHQVRQKVLLTDESEKVRRFYEKHGFNSCDKGALVAFAKMD